MNRTRFLTLFGWLLILALLFPAPISALAQGQTDSTSTQQLIIYTQYPSQMIGFGEVVTLPLKLKSGSAQTVMLVASNLPDGWNVSFHGGSRLVDAVYVDGVNEAEVDLRIDPPADVKAGKYKFTVVATGPSEKSELPLSFTVAEKLPPSLSLAVDGLPTKQSSPNASVTFNATLKNEGGEDLVVTLSATQPDNIQVTIKNSGQNVTELQLAANETKNLTITADPLVDLQAGNYPFTIEAMAGDVKADLDLGVEVVGEGKLTVTSPDGRLSGQAYAGQDNPLKIELSNGGTAPLRGIELTSSEPNGWSVTFDQPQIAEIPAGQKVDVTARVKPPDKAVAGDYMITINARPVESKEESADFRITVSTSTLWGVAGIGLIALSVAVVGGAVFRFGRR